MTALRVQPHLIVTAAIAVCLLAMVGRAISEARAEIDAAWVHDRAGATARAIEHYRRALRWSFPLSPYTAEAVSGLERIADDLERAGDIDGALLAWRSLAGGLGAARSLYVGANPASEHAKDEIARLLGRLEAPPIDASLTPDRLSEDHRRLLAWKIMPDPFWGSMLLTGFLVWVASLVWITRRGFDSEGNLRWREARLPASVALVGVISWVLGLIFA